jgi:Ca-activated chloride channel family protein
MTKTTTVAVALWLLLSGVVHAQTASFRIELRAELEARDPEAPRQPVGPLPLVDERVRTVIDGQHATTELTQVFHNRTGARLEGRYVLRPTMDARVQGFAYYVGEERIVGEVLERQAARRVYDQVTRRRRDPAILEQTADGEFTFRVFPIEPQEDKRVEITWGEWLERRGADVTYRVPVGSRETDAEVILRDPRARHVRSPSHAIHVEPIAGGLRVTTRGAHDERGELELRWTIEEAPWQPSAWVHRDEGHEGYFLLALAAPEGFEDRVSPKDVTLVLDRSGSMSGQAIANAREAAADVIRRLGHRDRVNVVAFDDDVQPLYHRPRPADAEVRADALAFVSRLRAGGGTDLAFALRRALESQHDRAGRPRVVIFVTDGQSAPQPVFETARADRRDVRVFTVGVGGGVNRALLGRLAAVKRGTFTHIDRAARIEPEVGHLYAQIARPLLVDVALEVEGAVASRIYPRTLPDLFVDDELVVSGRFRGDGPVRFSVRGTLGGRPIEMRTTAAPDASGRRPWVGRRWAASRVDHLLERTQLEGERPEIREEIVSLALAYDLVTPYTAFLAIPEREVTAAAAQTLSRARARRASAQARHADAVALSAGDDGAPAMERAAVEEAAPMPAADVGRAGCASCTVGRERPAPRALWLSLLAIGLIAWRRARRG